MLDDSVENETISAKFWNAVQRRVFPKNKATRVEQVSKLSSDDMHSLIKQSSHSQLQVMKNPEQVCTDSSRIATKRHSLDSMLAMRHQRIEL